MLNQDQNVTVKRTVERERINLIPLCFGSRFWVVGGGGGNQHVGRRVSIEVLGGVTGLLRSAVERKGNNSNGVEYFRAEIARDMARIWP